MCGILGVLAFGEAAEKKQEKLRQEAMIFLSSELLQLTQSRGKDATGIATMFANCDYMGLKMGIPSANFVSRFGGTEKDFDGYIKIWREKSSPAKMIIGHCRKSSVGNPEDNANNHPIKIDDIIGVHNGTLTNHEKIFKLLKCDRDGTVDSEAIFRLLHHFTNNGKEPFAPEIIQEVCKRLHGSYSCLAFAGNNPYQMVAFRDARPMEALLIKPLKLLLIASDKDFLKHVIFRYNKIAHLYQIGAMKFPPLKRTDIELISLPDDSLYIFDVRKNVEDTSKIEDLFITEKIPRLNKIWNGTFVSGNPNLNNAAYTTSSSIDRFINKTASGTKKDRIGMAWSKQTSRYEDVTGLSITADYPAVKIDPKDGSIIGAETEKVLVEGKPSTEKVKSVVVDDSKFRLNHVSKDLDSHNVSRVKIEELPAPVEESENNVTDTKEVVVLDKAEVIVETHGDILEKAEIALQKERNFTNGEEVQLALDIEKKEHLECLTTYSLANRIKKFFYKKGWYDGYISCSQELEKEKEELEALTPRNLLIRANNKRRVAERNIRIIKNIVQVFNNVITKHKVSDIDINTAVDTTICNNKELDTSIIENIFRPGDYKNMPILRKITSSINRGNVSKTS